VLLQPAAVCPLVSDTSCGGRGGPAQEQLAAICNEPVLQASTLRLLQERPFASLFPDLGNMTVFNPTGMEHVHNSYYVVFNRHAARPWLCCVLAA
jgi:hypothetical protein